MRIGTSLAALGFSALLAGASLAQSRDPAAAEALFRAARAAMETGDYVTACPKFEESNRLDPAVGTIFNLADCDEHLGKIASAWQLFKEVEQRLSASDERASIASSRAATLEPKLPRLKLKVNTPLPSGASVLRDGILLGNASFDLALPIDPGDHVLVVKAPGRADRQHAVKAGIGQVSEVVVEVGAPLPADAAAAQAKVGASDANVDTKSGPSSRTVGVVLIGVGTAGIVTSLIAGAVALTAKKTVDTECVDKQCTQAGIDAGDRGSTAVTISTIAFGVGLTGAAVGTVLLLTGKRDNAAPEPTKGPSVNAALLPGGGFVALRGSLW
jgi:hypothetical protein